jgi:hypothetical protein
MRVLALVALAAGLSACAVAQPAPRAARVVVVAAPPAGAVVVRHGSVAYHRAHGRYYRADRRGRYVAVAPPVGLVVRALPRRAERFRHRGAVHYRAAGVVYRPVRAGFVVVRL